MSKSLEQTKVAKKYVQALFASFAKDSEIKSAMKDMGDLNAMLSSSDDFKTFIETPLLSAADQKAGIEKLAKKAKLSKMVTNMLIIMADNRRLPLLPVVIVEAEKYALERSGSIPVKVATARKLTAADQKKIGESIKDAIGKDVIMQSYVDETLIGGIVLQIESTLIDGSVKTKLEKLERELTNKAA